MHKIEKLNTHSISSTKASKERSLSLLLKAAQSDYGRKVLQDSISGLTTIVQILADADKDLRYLAVDIIFHLTSVPNPSLANSLCLAGAIPFLVKIGLYECGLGKIIYCIIVSMVILVNYYEL